MAKVKSVVAVVAAAGLSAKWPQIFAIRSHFEAKSERAQSLLPYLPAINPHSFFKVGKLIFSQPSSPSPHCSSADDDDLPNKIHKAYTCICCYLNLFL
ncbi:hypothetical protein Ciccas_007141 [Cichlidogyrus casuarinus]|uniref:Uncharacterized protein n=1 Tax=Cichlidogyrus casuarinus TaxID=1844966 RepID=A0ABD2Q4V2_9PLAT